MKIVMLASVFAVASLLAPAVQADEVPSASPLTVTFEYNRKHGDDKVWTREAALNIINWRVTRDLGDGGGWTGISKLKLKASCPAPKVLKGSATTGFTWKGTPGAPEKYVATITTLLCE